VGHHAKTLRKVPRRIQGQPAQETPQGLRNPQSRPPLGIAHESGARPGKSQRLAGIGTLAAAWCEANQADNARRHITRTIQTLFGETPPDQLNPELFAQACLAHWRKRYSPMTRYNYASRLRCFGRWVDKLTSTHRLAEAVPPQAQPEPRTETISRADIERAVTASPPWFRVVLLSCYELALRSGTARQLAPRHYDQERKTITIETKGGQKVTLPVSPRLAALFEAAEAGDLNTPFWLAHRGTHALKDDRTEKANMHLLRNQWARTKRATGLPAHIWLHDLRRSIAGHGYEAAGKDIFAAQQLLGHKSTANTLRYLAPLTKDTAKLRAVLAQIWIPKGGVN
jgi:integrase